MSDRSQWTRRKFVGAGSVASIGLLAGCGGDDTTTEGSDGTGNGGETPTETGSGGDTTEGTGGGGSLKEERFDFVIGRPMPEVHFNPYNTQNFGQTLHQYLMMMLANGHADGTVQSRFLEDISTEGKEMTMTIPEGWTYWNGDEITAEDLHLGLELARYQNYESTNFEEHEIVDDYTVKRTFKNQVTPTLMRASLVGSVGFNHPDLFAEYLEQYQDATSADERQAVTEDLIQYKVSPDEFIDGGYGSGPYRPTDYNNEQFDAELVEDHPMAERTNISKIRVFAVGGQAETMAKNDELDRAYVHPNDTWTDGIDLEIAKTINWFRTQKFILNWNNKHLSNVNVRRAMAALMPMEAMAAAANEAGYNATATQKQTGLRESIHSEYLGDDFTSQLIDYPVQSDPDAATEYMEMAGYSKQGGSWVGPDGGEIEFNILSRDNTGQALPTTAFSDALNRFGIGTEVQAIGQDYYTTLQNWEFDMAWVWHVAKALWHPTAYFSNNFYGIKIGDPTKTEGTGPTGIPFTMEIPSEVGATEVGGSGEEIMPAKLSNDLPSSGSVDEVKQKTRKLSKWFNYSLPAIVYIQENQTRAMDTANFQVNGDPPVPLNVSEPILNGVFSANVSGKTS